MVAISISLLIIGIITLIFGLLVLFVPKVLRYLIGFYLIILGILTLIGAFI